MGMVLGGEGFRWGWFVMHICGVTLGEFDR